MIRCLVFDYMPTTGMDTRQERKQSMNSTQTGATAADSVRIEGTLAIITLGGSEYKF